MTAKPPSGAESARLLSEFLRSPRNRRTRWAIVLFLVVVIGISDSLSPSAYSLSFLYLVPVSLTAVWHGTVAATVIALTCFSLRLTGDVVLHLGAMRPNVFWNVAGMLVIHLFVVWLIHWLTKLHRQLEEKIAVQSNALLESAADRRRLEMEILDVAARERSAFGRELHDELGQHLVATALAAQTLAEKLGGRDVAHEALAIVHWIEEGIAKTRKLARGLLLGRVEPGRFAQELEELAIGASHGRVECRLHQKGGEISADATRCAQLFRIAQEAVGNALRHARPDTIQIILENDEEGLRLSILDDGCGMPEEPAGAEGLGMRIMEHRARIIGASLTVQSTPGGGTRVSCRLPPGEFSPV